MSREAERTNCIRISLAFVAGTIALGLAIGYTNRPGDWYAALSKPWFNPADRLFAPVWSALYLLIGLVGARSWMRKGGEEAFRLWVLQLALNLAWSTVFFSLHAIASALVIAFALLACVVVFIATQWPEDRVSGFLLVPYAVWIAFASLLNAAILVLN